jgi:transcriptional regulator with XRE-family HTH domain
MTIEEFLLLNIPELEKRTGINRGTLSKYFSVDKPETPTWKNICKISSTLEMSAEQVVKAIVAKRNKKLKELKEIVSNAQLNIVQPV